MFRGMAVAALVVCVLVAGCGGPFAEGEATGETTGDAPGEATDDAAANSEQVIAAPPTTTADATGTTAVAERRVEGATATDESDPAPTDEPAELTATRSTSGDGTRRTNRTATTTAATYDEDVGYEVRVSNAGPVERNVTVRIAAANDSAVAFDESVRIGPNESTTFGFTFPHVGAYEAAVTVGDATESRRWEVAVRNPDEALSVHVSESGEVYLGFVAI